MSAVTDLVLDPWLPLWLIAALLAVPLAFALYAALRGVRGQVWRVAFLALLGAALLNPSLTQEDRRPIDSLAVIVADRSSSLDIGERAAQRDAAVDALRAELDGMPGLAVRVVDAARDGTDETRLFDDLASALADVPRNQLAGILLVTDGQVHDAPDGPWQGIDVPIHALIAGSRSGVDRRISFVEPPAFGLVNQSVTLTVETATQPEDSPAPPPVVTLRRDGEVVAEVPVGRDGRATIEVPLVHGGQTVIEAEVPVIAGELTAANNHAAVAVNGVRDRLRVLL
ncbi:MAG: hypothetical protein KDA64_07710, partial [Rhodospirillaceae bacterium]|nr:hypothetical protein [Rhodospirillaceae bacterium]